jgi:tRNA-splicing ligase RtcB (3'-phosphate/5'-hydroxy nucleic acid ligase)
MVFLSGIFGASYMSENKFRAFQNSADEPVNPYLIKAWNDNVPFEEKAMEQLKNVARLPFVAPYVAAMPDTHLGYGATVGSVIPSVGAIMPAAVGVDIGCGMMAVRTLLEADRVKQCLPLLFKEISDAVPHGRTNNGGKGDRGAWHNIPLDIETVWEEEFSKHINSVASGPAAGVFSRHPQALSKNAAWHLGTLGTGNHFIELSEDEEHRIWVVLHSGSRGFGNRIGTYFTNLAKEKCKQWFVRLPDADLAYFPQGTDEFNDYLKALNLAQKYAWRNREIMMGRILKAVNPTGIQLCFDYSVHCHHNYMAEEKHFGKNVLLTRKGAVRADVGDYVIIPGSMGARTYIARGLGSVHSFKSCSHGAGRAMSRTEAVRRFTVADHETATEGVYCHKGKEVIDETPMAYKDIDLVMAAQTDLVEPVHVLKQVLCVKGLGE